MNDIRPPRKQQERPVITKSPDPTSESRVTVESLSLELRDTRPRKKKRSKVLVTVGLVLGVLILSVLAIFGWYQQQLQPVSDNVTASKKIVTIASGSSVQDIADTLKKEGVIRSDIAFDWYLRINPGSPLQAGNYVFRTNMSVSEIVAALRKGKTLTMTITFLPGATVQENKKVLLAAGFSKEAIDTAFSKQYNHPVFASKPASADLEGYIYGETYQFPATASVDTILIRTFDELYKVIQQEKLVDAYATQGLSLYQGITLASIIQREVPTAADQKQVAQVFLSRIKEEMNLGSDVTYQYIADKTGVARDPMLDSPYNTRRYAGLPPGPIAAPGKSALVSVAQPATGDYLFFLSGDDDKTYFARTQAEHEKNIVEHCKKKCQIL